MATHGDSYKIDLRFGADTKEATNALNKLKSELNSLASFSTHQSPLGITKELQEGMQAASALESHLKNAINTNTGKLDLNRLSQSFKDSNKSLQQYGEQLIKLGPEGQKAFLNVSNAIQQAEIPLKRANGLFNKLWTTMKDAARWQFSYGALNMLTGSISSAYNYANQLNKSLTNIRIVSEQTTEQMAEFAKYANKAAKSLSTTTVDYANAALIYYQQGLAEEEIRKRTETTIKMANASGQSAETVSNQLTAVWNNFYDGSKALEYYADVMTALGAATASSTEEISDGLEKFAAVAETVGLSYEYATSALATVTAETRQSADVVGTAFKTLFARIQGLKLGETLEDGTTLNQYSSALASVGINIKESNGELKDMDIILDEMGAKWGALSKDQQTALAQSVAGIRQYTQLVSLMENWDIFKMNLDIAKNSEGELQKQADIYAESWEAANDRVQASAESLYSSIIDDQFFISLTNGFANIIESVDKFLDSIGGIKTVLLGLGGILTRVFSKQLSASLSNASFGLMNALSGGSIKANKAQQMRQDAFDQSKNAIIAAGGTDVSAKAYSDTWVVQSKYEEKLKDMSELEKTINKDLLERIQIYKNLVVEQDLAANKIKTDSKKTLTGLLDEVNNEGVQALTKTGKKNPTPENFQEKQKKLIEQGYNTAGARTFFTGVTNKMAGLDTTEIEKYSQSLSEIVQQFTGIQASSQNIDDDIQNWIKGFGIAEGDADDLAKEIKAIIMQTEALDDNDSLERRFGNASDILERRQTGIRDKFSENQEKDLSRKGRAGYVASEVKEEQLANFDEAITLGEQYGQTQVELAQRTQNLKKAQDGLAGSLDKVIPKQKSASQTMIEVFGGLSSLAFGLQSVVSMFDTLNNTEMSWGEKLLSIFSSLTMSIPMILQGVSAIGQMVTAFKDGTIAKGIDTAATYLNAIAEEKLAKAKRDVANASQEEAVEIKKENVDIPTLGKSFKNLGTSLLKFLVPMLPAIIGLAIGGALIAIGDQIRNADQNALKKAQEQAKASSEAYDHLRNSYNSFTSNISDYENGIKGLKDLTKGTIEYDEAIQNANESALELIRNYKELQYTINDEGLITIDEQSLKDIKAEELKKLQAAQLSNQLSQQRVDDAELKVQQSEYNRKYLNDREFWNNDIAADTASGAGIGAIAGGIIATAILIASGFFTGGITWGLAGGAALAGLGGAAAGAIEGGKIGYKVGKDGEQSTKTEEELINDLFQGYKEKGNAIFAEKEMEKYLLEKGYTQELIDQLQASGTEIQDLIVAMDNNTKAQEAANKAIIMNQFSGKLSETGLTEKDWNNIASIISKDFSKKSEQLYEDVWKDRGWFSTGGKSDAEIQKMYAEAMGYSTTHIDNHGWGNESANYYDEAGNMVAENVSDEVARRFLAEQEALKWTEGNFNNYIENYKKLSALGASIGENVSQALGTLAGNMAEGGNFSSLSRGELDSLYSQSQSGQLNVTQDMAASWGYETVQQFFNALELAYKKADNQWQELGKTHVSAVQKAFNESINKEQLSLDENNQILDIFSNLFDQNGEEGLNLISQLFKDAKEHSNDLADLISNTDWSTASFDTLENIISETGTTTNLTTEQIRLLNDALIATKQETQTLEQQYENTVNKAKKLKLGDTVSTEDFRSFLELTEESGKYFTYMADGTYQLTRDAKEFYDLIKGKAQDNLIDKIGKIKQKIEELRGLSFDKNSSQPIQTENTMFFEPFTEGFKQMVSNKQIILPKDFDINRAYQYFFDNLNSNGTTYLALDKYFSEYVPSSMLDYFTNNFDFSGKNIIGDFSGLSNDNTADDSYVFKTIDYNAINLNNQRQFINQLKNLGAINSEDYDKFDKQITDIISAKTALKELDEDIDTYYENNDMETYFNLRKGYIEILSGIDALNNELDTLMASEEVQNAIEEAQKELEKYQVQLVNSYDTVKELEKAREEGYITDQVLYNNRLKQLQELERTKNLDSEEIYKYAEALKEANEDYTDEFARNVAISNLNMQNGLETLINDFDAWSELLTKDFDINDVGSYRVLQSLKESLSQILGLNALDIPTDLLITLKDDLKAIALGGENAASALENVRKALIIELYGKKYGEDAVNATTEEQVKEMANKILAEEGYAAATGYMRNMGYEASEYETEYRIMTTKTVDDAGKEVITTSEGNYVTSFKELESTDANNTFLTILNTLFSNDNKKRNIQTLDELKERYKEVNELIEEGNRKLQQQEKITQNLVGKNRVSSLKEELKILEQLNNSYYQRKVNEAIGYVEIDKQDLEKAGFELEYDENGFITNWEETQERLIKKLTKMQKDGTDEEIDAAQKELDTFETLTSEYEDSLKNQWEAEQAMAENKDKIAQKKYQIATEFNNLTLEANKEFLEREKKQLEEFKKNNDFSGISNSISEQMNLISKNLDLYANNLDKINKSDLSDAQKAEEKKKLIEQIKQEGQAYEQLAETLSNLYQDQLNNYNKQVDEQVAHLEKAMSLLKKYNDLLQLMGKSKDFDLIRNITQKQVEVAKISMDTALTQEKNARERYKAAVDAFDAVSSDPNSVDYKEAKENVELAFQELEKAQENSLNKTKEYFEALAAVRDNELAAAADTYEKAVTGGKSFEEINKELEHTKTIQENYLTTTNKIYETNKMIRDVEQEIAKTTNEVSKRKLKAFQNELKQLKEQNKLSQAELDIQQAEYNLLIAQLALEEAQNAKSQVRLIRDAEGNFGYMYTADEADIMEKQQAVEDAENELYNKRLENTQKYVDKNKEIVQKAAEEVQKLNEKRKNGEKVSEEEYQKIYDRYSKEYNINTNLLNKIVGEDQSILEDIIGKDYLDLFANPETFLSAITNYGNNIKDIWSEYFTETTEGAEQSGLNNLSDELQAVADRSVELNKILNGPDGLIETLSKEMESVDSLVENYTLLASAKALAAQAYDKANNISDELIEASGVYIKDNKGNWTVNPERFATGGYTGSWGSEGKLAILDEKELILKEDDTANFLASLDLLHDIVKIIDMQSTGMAFGRILNTPYLQNNGKSETLEQNVRIEAVFPNATDRFEIEEAFKSLNNQASQYINRK